MYLLYLDESGIRNSKSKNPREDSNFFTLGGVIIKEENYHWVCQKFKEFKQNNIHKELIIKPLHAVELNNLAFNKDSEYLKFMTPQEAKEVLLKFYNFIASLPIEGIAIIIDHYKLCEKYPFPQEPYPMAYKFVLEKFQKIIKKRSESNNSLGLVHVAYSYNATSHKIEQIHANALEKGSEYVTDYKNILPNVVIQSVDKSVLFEIADLICYAFSRGYRGWLCENLGKKVPEEPDYIEIIKPICDNIHIGNILLGKANLKIFPGPRFLEERQKEKVNPPHSA